MARETRPLSFETSCSLVDLAYATSGLLVQVGANLHTYKDSTYEALDSSTDNWQSSDSIDCLASEGKGRELVYPW